MIEELGEARVESKERLPNGKFLILGGSGLVGLRFLDLYGGDTVAPGRGELDIKDSRRVKDFIKKHNPNFIVNFAADTRVSEAEKERGEKNGKCWKTNVKGVKNLALAAKNSGAFFIQLSTDFVFPGTQDYQGPYSERQDVARDEGELGWYALSKLAAEREIQKLGGFRDDWAAIVRISFPFGNPNSPGDYAIKILQTIERGGSLFDDQMITPTYIPDLGEAIRRISSRMVSGIFHIASGGITTPYNFGIYLARKVGLEEIKVKRGSFKDYYKKNSDPARRPRLGGLVTEDTQGSLGLNFKSWKEAVEDFAKNSVFAP